MEKAEYPLKSCREGIFNDQAMGYTCELPDLHPGPCANFSIKASVEARDRWEEANPDWKRRIGQDIEV